MLPISPVQTASAAEEVLIFQPSGGANDGSDTGGAISGKDAGIFAGETSNNGNGSAHHHFFSNCNSINAHSLYQWDVSGLPDAATVSQVKAIFHMRIRRDFQPYQINPTTMQLKLLGSAWNEMTVNAFNHPLIGNVVASVDVPTPLNGTYDGTSYVHFEGEVSFDITQLYKDWKNGVVPNNGVLLSRAQAFCENTNETLAYTSDNTDSTLRPRLEITHSVTTYEKALEHLGSNDPVTEGWAMHPGYRAMGFGPLAPDGGFGENAWFVDDNSTLGGSTLTYDGALTDAQLARAAETGWRLAARLRVADIPDAVDSSVFAGYNTADTRYSMLFGSDAGGNPIVRLWDGTFGPDGSLQGPSYTASGNGYHLYELIFEPVSASATLLVDGIEVIGGYTGFYGVGFKGVMWGGGQSSTTGQGNWNMVSWGMAGASSPASQAGTPWAWGFGGYGGLAIGTNPNVQNSPVQTSFPSETIAVAGGHHHTLAVQSDGTVLAAGHNNYGQLGNGATADKYLPVQVSGLTGVTAVDAGVYHSMALKSDGTVWAWGLNNWGQLGIGTTATQYMPVQVSGLTDVVAISCGDYYSLALKSDGTVWAWGYNYHGELGIGNTAPRSTPVQVLNLTEVIAISAGANHGMALTSNGTIMSWGYNQYGQVGNGATAYGQNTPVQVMGLSGVKAISGGGHYSMALTNDGSVWTWGRNEYGQLGLGATIPFVPAPVLVPGLTGISRIATGAFHALVLKDDSSLWTWGRNDNGQLGLGPIGHQRAPLQVSGVSNVFDIATGGYHSLALVGEATNQNPVADAGAAQTLQCTGNSSADVMLDGSASSDPDGDTLSYAWTWSGGSATGMNPTVSLPLGTTEVTLNVDDGNGGVSSAMTTVTVQDTEAPVVDAGADKVIEATNPLGEDFNVLGQATATDSCCAIASSATPSGPYALGSVTVTVSASDCEGNTGSDQMVVTVVDTTPPQLLIPGNVTQEAAGIFTQVDIGTASASDIFGAVVTSDAPPGGFPVGVTAVIWTAVDGNGLVSIATQTVTVLDSTEPMVTAPADIIIEATGPLTDVDLGAASATDLVDGDLTPTADQTGPFGVGVHTITWSAADSHGNTGTATQTVTVSDTTPPVVTIGGELSFLPAELISDSGRVTGVTSADFNGDGHIDLAMVNYDASAFKVYHGDGNGGFTPGISIGTPATPTYIDSGDFNNDGNIDVVVASAASDSVLTWLGNGAGNFTPAGVNPVPTDPVFAVPFDFNNDGNMDLLAGANNGGWRLYVLQGAGNGTFTNVSSFGGERNPRHPAIADFNGDGYVDVLVPTAISNVATLFTNNGGSGSFSNAGVKTSAVRMEGAVAGDFNTDGLADVAISIAPSNKVRVMLGDGAGNFSAPTDYATEAWPNILRMGDMNSDGIMDVVAVAGGGMGAGISVLISNGDGTFQPASNYTTAAFAGSLTLADFNRDGQLDAATSYQDVAGVGGAYVLLNSSSGDITVEATGPTTPVAIGPATAYDLVDGPLTPTADNEGPFALGSHTVTWSATDSHANTGTATQGVTVVDTTPPLISAPGSITVEAVGPFTPIEFMPLDAFDLVDGALMALPLSSGPFPVGTAMVTYGVADSSGNAASIQQSVTVTDTTPPVISTVADITMEATAPLTPIPMGPLDAFDLVDGPLLAFPDVTGPFPVGTTLVTYTVTDNAGNSASMQQNVTVTDTTPPVVDPVADITLEATGPLTDVSLPAIWHAFDLVDGDSLPVLADNRGPFAVGTHTVTWSATDIAGNTGTYSQTVTVVDTTPPQLILPDDVSMEATGPLTTLNIGMAMAIDLVDGPVAVASDAPATFPVGTTLVVWTAVDAHGNSVSGTQSVSVTDTTAPAVTAPADVSVEASGPFTDVALGSASAFDLVDGALPATPDQTGPFAVGSYSVIWSATDTAGNTGASSQAVNVNDTTPPDLGIPADIAVEATAVQSVVDIGMALAIDLVDGPVAVSHNAPAAFPLGTTRVTWLASDAHGNSVTATQSVTVLDSTAPLLTLPDDMTKEATGALTPVDIGTATASDIFGVEITSDAPSAFPVGTTTVTWTATDGNGLSTSGTQSITVTDSTAPAVSAPADITLEATGPMTDVALGSASAIDLVDGELSATPDQIGPFGVGEHLVTWTASDAAGNTGTATQTVMVIDTTAPTVTAPADVYAEANAVLSTLQIGTATAFDLVDGELSASSDAPAGFPLGDTLVTWMASDLAGNEAMATQAVTVSDTTAPVLSVPADVSAEANGVLSTVDIGTATATDIFEVAITNNAPAAYPLGSTTVTWTATDANGNTATASQTVTVSDTTAPVLSVPADVTAEATGVLTDVAIGTATATDAFEVAIANNAPAAYPLGSTTVTWTATDANGNTATATQIVTVSDTTAPTVTAELVPVKLKKHEGTFRVEFSASDLVDPNPALTATLNGVSVTSGQVVELKAGKKVKIKTRHGEIEITAPSFTLDVSATDASGNAGSASASYAFPAPKDEHDDHGIHRGNDKDDHHADKGQHKSEGKTRIEHKDNKKSDSKSGSRNDDKKSKDRKSSDKKDKKRS